MIGLRYRFGGNTPESGLDCSGFVRYVFNDTFGFLLPRRAVEMSRVGTSVDMAELRPGDLVFFNTMRHTFSHVGIYIGDNKFVHAPSTGSKIRVDDMTASYWVTRYNGARRIDGNASSIKDGADNFVEQLKRIDPNAAGKPLALYGG
jgi:cell wall-associated NlpC family hydrolase